MAGKITINSERCKGCGLCIPVCPQQNLSISSTSNSLGHFPAEFKDQGCTGCGLCALMCPDVAIEVQREKKTTTRSSSSRSAAKVHSQ